jgi:hypothetical protein
MAYGTVMRGPVAVARTVAQRQARAGVRIIEADQQRVGARRQRRRQRQAVRVGDGHAGQPAVGRIEAAERLLVSLGDQLAGGIEQMHEDSIPLIQRFRRFPGHGDRQCCAGGPAIRRQLQAAQDDGIAKRSQRARRGIRR